MLFQNFAQGIEGGCVALEMASQGRQLRRGFAAVRDRSTSSSRAVVFFFFIWGLIVWRGLHKAAASSSLGAGCTPRSEAWDGPALSLDAYGIDAAVTLLSSGEQSGSWVRLFLLGELVPHTESEIGNGETQTIQQRLTSDFFICFTLLFLGSSTLMSRKLSPSSSSTYERSSDVTEPGICIAIRLFLIGFC